jgi:hypothetical protein
MASQNSLIVRNDAARKRLKVAFEKLRSQGVDVPDFTATHRDPEVAHTQELEFFASVVESFIAPEKEPQPEPIMEPQPEPEPQPQAEPEVVEPKKAEKKISRKAKS